MTSALHRARTSSVSDYWRHARYVPTSIEFLPAVRPPSSVAHARARSDVELAPRLATLQLLVHLAHLHFRRASLAVCFLAPSLLADLARRLCARAGRRAAGVGVVDGPELVGVADGDSLEVGSPLRERGRE